MTSKKPARTFLPDSRWVYLLAMVIFGCNLWGYDLWAPDEPFFGEGAREMIADGHWIVSYVNGEVNTHKPPLFFWLIALFSLPFGEVLSLTARLPSVLAGLGSIALTMRLGRLLCGSRTAILAGTMLATSLMFWEKARMAQIDSVLCFLILCSLSAFEAFRSERWSGRKAGLVFWACIGLALLAKGPVGLLLPLGISLLTLASDRQLGRWRSFAPLSGPLVCVAITGAWVVATYWEPNYSILGALREHFVDRAIHGMAHVQPVWYYARVLPLSPFPWSFLIPGALVLAWRRRMHKDDRFLLVGALFAVVVFTISTEKRDLYILPSFPFFTLLSARLIAAVLGWWPSTPTTPNTRPQEAEALSIDRRWVIVPQGLVGALMVVASIAAVLLAPRFGSEMIAPAAALAAVFGFGGAGILTWALRGRTLESVQWTAAAMACSMLVAVTFIYPVLEPAKSGRALAQLISRSPVGSSDAYRPILGLDLENVPNAINLYSNGIYFEHIVADELLERLERSEALYLLANEAALPDLSSEQRERMEILHSTRLSRKNLLFLHFGP